MKVLRSLLNPSDICLYIGRFRSFGTYLHKHKCVLCYINIKMCSGKPVEVSDCAILRICLKLNGAVYVWMVPFWYIVTGRCNNEEILFSVVICDISQ